MSEPYKHNQPNEYDIDSSGNYRIGTSAELFQSNLEQIAQDLLQLNSSSRQDLTLGYTSVNNDGTGIPVTALSVTGSSFESNTYSTASGLVSSVLSSVEQAILRSQVPIEINDTEEITVNGQRGLWANKDEVNFFFLNYLL
jgi:hypothetical protein